MSELATAEAEAEIHPPFDDPEVKSKGKQPRESRPMSELRINEERGVKEWLETISQGPVRVKVERISPKNHRGKNVGGLLATYEHQIDEDWVREHHGGGIYNLKVMLPKDGGGWKYGPTRQIEIAGDPRTDDVFRDDPPPAQAASAGPGPAIVDRAFGAMERQLERAQKMPVNQNTDIEAMRLLIMPLQSQIDGLTGMLREKDRQLAAAQAPKPPERDEFRDRILDKMFDGESARILAIRTEHDSEVRQLKQAANDNEARIREGFERDKQLLVMMQDRERQSLVSAYDMKIAALQQAADTTRALLEHEVRRIQADLTEAKAEIVILREKKDKGPIEMAAEVAKFKEALGIDGENEEKKSITEKVLDKVIEGATQLPVVQNAIAKAVGGEQPQPAPAQQVQPRRQQAPALVTGPDGNIYQQLPSGRLKMIPRVTAPANDQVPAPQSPPVPQIPVETVKQAVGFLESAFRGGQDPVGVAISVRSMVPTDVLEAIRQLGIDKFLADIARLDGSSPLTSQAGRNWSRKLGKALVGE